MAQEYTSMSDDIEEGGKKAVEAARDTAKAAGTVKRAAGKAATGNYVGAAADLVTNKTVRRTIIFGPVIVMALLMLVLYMFPMAIYEETQAAGEAYQSTYYVGEGGHTFKAIGEFFKSLVGQDNDFYKYFGATNLYETTDGTDDDDYTLVGTETLPADFTYARMVGTQEKFSDRANEIASAISSSAIQSTAADKAAANFKQSFGNKDAEGLENAEYAGTGMDLRTSTMNDLSAAQIVELYSVLYDNQFNNTQLSDYLVWLGSGTKGSKLSGNKAPSIQINGMGTYATVDGWFGTFMPQYLLDEAQQEADRAGTIAGNYAESEYEKQVEAGTASLTSTDPYDTAYKNAYQNKIRMYTQEHGASAIDLITTVSVSSRVTASLTGANKKLVIAENSEAQIEGSSQTYSSKKVTPTDAFPNKIEASDTASISALEAYIRNIFGDDAVNDFRALSGSATSNGETAEMVKASDNGDVDKEDLNLYEYMCSYQLKVVYVCQQYTETSEPEPSTGTIKCSDVIGRSYTQTNPMMQRVNDLVNQGKTAEANAIRQAWIQKYGFMLTATLPAIKNNKNFWSQVAADKNCLILDISYMEDGAAPITTTIDTSYYAVTAYKYVPQISYSYIVTIKPKSAETLYAFAGLLSGDYKAYSEVYQDIIQENPELYPFPNKYTNSTGADSTDAENSETEGDGSA